MRFLSHFIIICYKNLKCLVVSMRNLFFFLVKLPSWSHVLPLYILRIYLYNHPYVAWSVFSFRIPFYVIYSLDLFNPSPCLYRLQYFLWMSFVECKPTADSYSLKGHCHTTLATCVLVGEHMTCLGNNASFWCLISQ